MICQCPLGLPWTVPIGNWGCCCWGDVGGLMAFKYLPGLIQTGSSLPYWVKGLHSCLRERYMVSLTCLQAWGHPKLPLLFVECPGWLVKGLRRLSISWDSSGNQGCLGERRRVSPTTCLPAVPSSLCCQESVLRGCARAWDIWVSKKWNMGLVKTFITLKCSTRLVRWWEQ